MLYGCLGQLSGCLRNPLWGYSGLVALEKETEGRSSKRLAFLDQAGRDIILIAIIWPTRDLREAYTTGTGNLGDHSNYKWRTTSFPNT
jgi:hypothetical protein